VILGMGFPQDGRFCSVFRSYYFPFPLSRVVVFIKNYWINEINPKCITVWYLVRFLVRFFFCCWLISMKFDKLVEKFDEFFDFSFISSESKLFFYKIFIQHSCIHKKNSFWRFCLDLDVVLQNHLNFDEKKIIKIT
jgi:hypothetical protein